MSFIRRFICYIFGHKPTTKCHCWMCDNHPFLRNQIVESYCERCGEDIPHPLPGVRIVR